MRLIFTLPLLMVAACDIQSDSANDQTTLSYNQERIEGAAEDVGNAAGEVAADVGNAAEDAGRAIENGVGDIDVDVNRDRAGNSN